MSAQPPPSRSEREHADDCATHWDLAAECTCTQSSGRFADAVAHRRVCMFCGERATVFGPPEWDDLDVDAEFASEGRSFSDVPDGDPIGVGCMACSREQWKKAEALGPMTTQSSSVVGRTMLVFNARDWVEAGYDQPEGNGRFMQPARILEVINGSGLTPDGSREQIATVEWADGRRSAGHFVHLMEEVPVIPPWRDR